MNSNQKNTVQELSQEHHDYVAKYGVGDSNHFWVFEDESGNVYVYAQKVKLRSDYAGVDYHFSIHKIDKAGFEKEVEPMEYKDGGEIEYLKKLKKIN